MKKGNITLVKQKMGYVIEWKKEVLCDTMFYSQQELKDIYYLIGKELKK